MTPYRVNTVKYTHKGDKLFQCFIAGRSRISGQTLDFFWCAWRVLLAFDNNKEKKSSFYEAFKP